MRLFHVNVCFPELVSADHEEKAFTKQKKHLQLYMGKRPVTYACF